MWTKVLKELGPSGYNNFAALKTLDRRRHKNQHQKQRPSANLVYLPTYIMYFDSIKQMLNHRGDKFKNMDFYSVEWFVVAEFTANLHFGLAKLALWSFPKHRLICCDVRFVRAKLHKRLSNKYVLDTSQISTSSLHE